MGFNEPHYERKTMNDALALIESIENFTNTMTSVLPKIAMIAGILGFVMMAIFTMKLVAAKS